MGVSHIKLGNRTAHKSIRVGVAGFEDRSRAAINLFFMQQAQLFDLVTLEHAEVIILDMDHPGGQELYTQYRGQRPILAVTATEKSFDGLVTITKPLDGKRLTSALQQAQQEFVPATAEQTSVKTAAVSSEGEKAFQEYQKRIAAGRQAMEDYQQHSANRETLSSQLSSHLALPERDRQQTKVSASIAEKPVAEPVPVAAPVAEKATVRTAPAVAKKPAAAAKKIADAVAQACVSKPAVPTLPVGRLPAEKKPAEVKAKLSYQMVYECCGNAPDVNMHDPEQRRRVFFKDDLTLLAVLQQAVREAEQQAAPVEIEGLPGTLAYLPGLKRFLFDFNEELLIPLALTRFGYQELTLKNRPDLDAERPAIGSSKVVQEPGDELLWKVALWTSKGRLNRRIDPEKPCRLASELDFDRLLAIPHATTISSLWGRHSLSALEVVNVLKIHQRYVFAFMSAAQAIGAFK